MYIIHSFIHCRIINSFHVFSITVPLPFSSQHGNAEIRIKPYCKWCIHDCKVPIESVPMNLWDYCCLLFHPVSHTSMEPHRLALLQRPSERNCEHKGFEITQHLCVQLSTFRGTGSLVGTWSVLLTRMVRRKFWFLFNQLCSWENLWAEQIQPNYVAL